MQRRLSPTLVAAALALSAGLPATAVALDKEYVAAPAAKAEDAGWHGSLRVGANVNFTHNLDVVGQVDGQQWTLGGSFNGDIGYRKGEHDWRNELALLETFSYGPPIKAFVKTSDTLSFDTAYFYHPSTAPWVGPFVRAAVLTSIFEGVDHRAAPVDYVVTNETDPQTSAPKIIAQKKRFQLSESFRPTTLKESAGVFLNPYSKSYLDILILAGFGSHQVFSDGQYALSDNAATPMVELSRLRSFQQVGAEVGLYLTGNAYTGKIKYKAYGDVLVPLYRANKAPGDNRGAGEMTNVEIGAMLSFKLVDWASVDYILKTLRQPQLVDKWQAQNMLLLTFSYSYSKRQIPPPAPAPAPAPAAAN